MRRFMVLFVGLCLVMAFGLKPSMAGEKTAIAGKLEATYTKQEPIDIGDTESHMMILAVSEGTNTNTGEHEFMDGASLVNVAFSDLVKGNGVHQGYIKFVKDGDGTYAKWEGTVTTTMSAEDTPLILFEGTFSYISGMGQYEHIQGSGTYKGHYTSETSYTVEWGGEYFIKEE